MSNNKKYVSLARLSDFLDNIKSKYSLIGHKHTVADLSDYIVDTTLSSTSVNPVQNKVLDAEFDAMATAMGALELAIDGKSDSTHNHNDLYYTETEINQKLASKSDSTHNHDDKYDAKGASEDALTSAKSYTDTKTSNLASTTVVDNKVSSHNTSTSSHSDIRDLISGLTTRLNTLANSDDTTLDQMSEVVAYIKNNKNLIDGITTNKVNVSDIVNNLTTNISNKPLSAAQGVAIKNLIDALQEELDSHSHAISDVSGLQSALDGKAASSHGTHVSYSTTAPVMDGTASVGSASTVARSDHKHPTDTSRASKTEFDTHTSDTTKHITSAERTNWNDAKIKIDGVEAGAKVNVQSDWNVNDASSDAYVKNRPFWSDDPVETLLVDSVTFNTQAYGDIAYARNPFSLELIEGVTYDVIWNGTKYTSVCVSLSGVPALGNASILGMGANTNEPFLINYANGNYVYTSSPVSVTIKVVGHISEIHKIDNKYIDFPNFPEGSYVGAFGQNSGEIFNDYQGNTASGALSHAEGGETTASGNFSHAEGAYTTASGHWSHAEGYHSTASVRFSHAEGYGTNAAADAQHAQGKFNVIDTDGKYAHIVGNGTSDSNRVNIHTVDWYGNAWFDGDVYVGGTSQADASKVITEADKELLLPKATASDNGKVLRVVDGAWAADELGGTGGGNSSNNNVTLTVAGWNNDNEQTVNVEGVTATNTVIVGGDLGSEPHYTDCGVYCSGQGDGTLTFKCTLPPSEDLVANVAIL